MKKKIIIFILIIAILIFIYLIFILSISSPSRKENVPTIIPTIEVVQDVSAPSIPPEMRKEKELEGNYALERQKFLEDKPWMLKLPLESDNYFITYDIEKSKFIITVYYYLSNNISKNQQVIQARKEALEALNKLDVNFFKEDVEFMEFERN